MNASVLRLAAAVALWSAACGRIGFDPAGGPGGPGDPDAGVTGQAAWVAQIGPSASPIDVAVSADGRVYVLARLTGTIDFGEGTVFTNAGRSDLFVVAYDAAGAFAWARRFEDTSTTGGIIVVGSNGIAVDPDGHVVVAGEFAGTVDFGDGPRTSNGAADGFVVSLETDGAFWWARTFGGTLAELVGGVAVSDDRVIVGGSFPGTVDFGGGPLTASGSRDLFLLAYALDGTFSAAKRHGGAGQESCTGVAIDGGGGVFVVGSFDTTSDLGKGPLTSLGQADMFVARYDAAGAATLVLTGGGVNYDVGWGVAVDPAGRILASGDLDGSGAFGGAQLTGAGARDILLLSFDPAGALGWHKLHGGSGYDTGADVVVDGRGDSFVTGHFSGTVDLGAGPVTSAGNDIFLASYTPAGALRWVRTWGSTGADEGRRLALGRDGTIFLVGQAAAPLDLDGTTVSGSFVVALR